MIMTITILPPTEHAKIMFVIEVLGELGTTQSSSVNDSTFVGQVGSMEYTVPVTDMDGPLLTQEEINVAMSCAE